MREREIPERIKYIRKLFAPEDSSLRTARKQAETLGFPIYIGAEEGKLLQVLVKIAGVKKVLEIGTLTGYSTLWIAKALPTGGKIFTLEKEAVRSEIARKIFNKSKEKKKIRLVTGTAQEKLEEMRKHAPFDMVFIDADKISYIDYLNWAERNLKKGGVIIADNTFLFEAVYQKKPADTIRPTTIKNIREFNRRLSDPKKYCGIMVPSKEGMTIAIKLF